MKTILFELAVFGIALLLSLVISKRFQTWIIRRKIKRLKADFAKLQRAVLQAEQMKSAIRNWTLKH